MLETNEKPSFSRYTISSTLGTGGMGTVYRAHHEILDRPVALKVPKEEFTRDHVFVERFMREAKALGTLKHPHVVAVYDAGIEHGVPYIAMECVEGKTLAEIVRDGGVLAVEDIARWGYQMADALAYVHDCGVLHRDLKSANVIINRAGAAVITDFGIARLEESTTQITRGMIGTPAYMSPEQARGQPIDARSDLYSLGIILYECLTGEVPFADENALALIQKVINESPPALLRRRPDTPAWLRGIVFRCLEKTPTKRFKNGLEMANALRPYAAQEPVGRREETALTVWQQPADTIVSPPHREAARHFTLAVANLARAIQIGGGRVRTSIHDGMTRTWYVFQQRTEVLSGAFQPHDSSAATADGDPDALATALVAQSETPAGTQTPGASPLPLPAEAPGRRIPALYRTFAVVLVVSLSITALRAVIAPLLSEEAEVDSWGAYVSPSPDPLRPEAAYTPLPPQELSGPTFSDASEPPAEARVAAPDTVRGATGHISSASARRRRLIATSRPVDIQPLELEPLGGASIGSPASPTRFAVLPSSIWELQEQKTSRSFLRHLRSKIKDRLVAVLDPDDVQAPEAAYVFLVDELEDTVPHMLAWRDEAWTDLKTGHGFVMTEHGFRPAAGEVVAPEDWPLEAYWVEYAENGVIRNKKRVGW